MNYNIFKLIGITLVGVFVLAGCSPYQNMETSDMESQLRQKDREIAKLSKDNEDKTQTIEDYRMQLEKENAAKADAERRYQQAKDSSAKGMSSDTSLFPPDPKAGECYARVFVPPAYRTRSETVLKKGASERLEVVPARYEWAEETVMVKEASERIEIIPAKYDWVEERVMVKSASTKLIEVPAKYEWQEERVLVKPAHTVWKKGRGPIEKVDNITGEIMCLVEVPATYRTVKKQVMVSPPSTKKLTIPAEYNTIKKRMMVQKPEERRIAIPAEYKTVKVRKQVAGPTERRMEIPAEYQTVKHTEKISEGHMEWRRILCETNVDKRTITRVQTALRSYGHNPGPIDGILGRQTSAALKSFQRANNLAVGGLTYETLERLRVSL